jgi:hypothetical protein
VVKGLVWYTDGSRTAEGSGAGVYGQSANRRFSISLGKHATVFQAEVYAFMKLELMIGQRNMLVFAVIARRLCKRFTLLKQRLLWYDSASRR